jgi:predicted enzyme related to lactoylglutathione lyase
VAELLERECDEDGIEGQSGWLPSICVGDVKNAMDLVEASGGEVLEPPVLRVGRGRAATVVDPGGAPLRLWQPAGGVVGEALRANGRNPGPARPTWLELETPEIGAVIPFYRSVFGWELTEYTSEDGSPPYLLFSHLGERVAGLIESPLRHLSGSWCPAFDVVDVDQVTDVAVERGAVALAEPTDIAVGRQSVVVDPLGAVFSLLGPIPEGPRAL